MIFHDKTAIMLRTLWWLTLLFLLGAGCNATKKLEAPKEQYNEYMENNVSFLSIPARIGIKELERSLNQQLDGVVYEDDSYSGDNMQLRVTKNQDINLKVYGQEINYIVPVDIWVRYNAGITKVEADGEIELEFTTAFDINNDWNIETETELTRHQWLRTPRINVIGINLPIGSVANLVLNNARGYISRTIDDLVRDNLDLRSIVDQGWKMMYSPILVSEEYSTWMIVNPKRIAMTPLNITADSIQSTVVIESQPELVVGGKPLGYSPQPLPPLNRQAKPLEGFMIKISTKISYEEAERIGKAELVGQTYQSGKRSVTVEDLEIYGQGNQLVVDTKLSGSYNGSVYLTGEPVYNERRNRVELEDLDFTLNTQNALYRSAGWLLKGTIKKQIQKNLDFLLDYNLNAVKEELQAQLTNYPLGGGLVINGNLQELNIQNVFLAPDGMRVNLVLAGEVALEVD